MTGAQAGVLIGAAVGTVIGLLASISMHLHSIVLELRNLRDQGTRQGRVL